MYPVSLIDAEGLHPPGIHVEGPGANQPQGKKFRFPGIPFGDGDRLMVDRVMYENLLNRGSEKLYAADIIKNDKGFWILKPVHRSIQVTGKKHLIILRLGTGFGGSNSYTGDRKGYVCQRGPSYAGCGFEEHEPIPPEACPKCGGHELIPFFHDFLGRKVWEKKLGGSSRRKAARDVHLGSHLVAMMDLTRGPIIFRAAYEGPRLDGRPQEEYFLLDQSGIEAATWQDRLDQKVDW